MAYGKIKADAIIYDNSGSDVEKTVVSLTTPEGTAIKSTGESGTAKFLRVDGDGTCSWAVPPDTQLPFFDEDNMSSNSNTGVPSQQSVKAYVDAGDLSLIDEDNMSSNSAGRPPSQQSVKAYVDGQTLSLIDEDNMASNSASRPPSQQSVKAYVDTADALKANLAAPAFTGTATGVNLTLSGNLTVNGTTTTVATTNTTITDNLIELNSGAGSNANDAGILIERGSTGDNAIIAWDESADKFIVGTTTAANNATGDLTIAAGTIVATTFEGGLSGNASTATTASSVTVTDGGGDTNCFPMFTASGATGNKAPKTGTNLTFNDNTGNLTATILTDGKGNVRSIVQNTQGSAYTLVAADAGKHILASGAVTIPNSVFAAGDAVTIVNNTAGDIAITKATTNLYWTSDGSDASRTLGTRGMVTILFASATAGYLSGSGVS